MYTGVSILDYLKIGLPKLYPFLYLKRIFCELYNCMYKYTVVEESNCPFLGFALPMSRFQIILLRVELYVMLKVM